MATHHTNRGSIAGLLFGGLVGAGVALMAAPRSGKESRQKIEEFTEDVKGRARCYALRTRERMNSAVEKGKDFVQRRKSLIMTAIDAGKEAYAKERLRRARERSCGQYEKGAGSF